MGEPEGVEPVTDATAEPAREEPNPGRWQVVTLVAGDGQEPPPGLSDSDARSTWAAVSAPWHPAVLAVSKALPRLEDAAYASTPEADEARIVAAAARDRLPSGHNTQAAD